MQECDVVTVGWPCSWDMKIKSFRQGEKGNFFLNSVLVCYVDC